MAGDALLDASQFGRPAQGFLHRAGADLMASGQAAARVCGEQRGGEDILLDLLEVGFRIFVGEGAILCLDTK